LGEKVPGRVRKRWKQQRNGERIEAERGKSAPGRGAAQGKGEKSAKEGEKRNFNQGGEISMNPENF